MLASWQLEAKKPETKSVDLLSALLATDSGIPLCMDSIFLLGAPLQGGTKVTSGFNTVCLGAVTEAACSGRDPGDVLDPSRGRGMMLSGQVCFFFAPHRLLCILASELNFRWRCAHWMGGKGKQREPAGRENSR